MRVIFFGPTTQAQGVYKYFVTGGWGGVNNFHHSVKEMELQVYQKQEVDIKLLFYFTKNITLCKLTI